MNTFISWFVLSLLLVASCVHLSSAAVPNLKKYIILGDGSTYCNDGSPAVYYIRAGRGGGINRWVIRLQGGSYCYDNKTCLSRAQMSSWWTSSKVCPPEINDNQGIGPGNIKHGGILSGDQSLNPNFYDSNHVYVWYCSSDSFIGGDPDTKSTPLNWYFQGRKIISNLILDLLRYHNLNHASQILITGDASGGVGTFSNIDHIAELAKPFLLNSSAVIRGFVDSGWYVDMPPYSIYYPSVQQKSILFTNTMKAVYDQDCMNMFQSSESWKCFVLDYAYKYIRTPIFYNQFQMDSGNLKDNGVNFPFDPSSGAYAYRFKMTLIANTANVSYLFFPDCYKHTIEDSNAFLTLSVDRTTISNALWAFFTDRNNPPTPIRYVDTCNSFNCNESCPANYILMTEKKFAKRN